MHIPPAVFIAYPVKTVFIIIIAVISALILFCSDAAISGASKGFEIFISNVFPALFPFFVCINALKYTGAFSVRKDSCGKSGFAKAALKNFIIAGLSGFPAGAMLSKAAFRQGSENIMIPDENEFSMLCAITTLASPVFITASVANRMLRSSAAALPVAVCHYGTALLFLTGFILMQNKKEKAGRTVTAQTPSRQTLRQNSFSKPMPLSAIFPKAVSDSVFIMLRLGGTLIFFTVITEIPASWKIFNGIPSGLKGLFFGSFEITNGISLIASCALNLRTKCAFICSLLSFGGICVYMQAAGIADIRPKSYFFIKFLQSAVSGGLCYLVYPVFSPASGPVSNLFGDTLGERIVSMGELMLLGILASVFAVLISVFTAKRTKA